MNGFIMLGVAVGLGAVAALFIPAITSDTNLDRVRETMLRHLDLAPVAGGSLVGYKSE